MNPMSRFRRTLSLAASIAAGLAALAVTSDVEAQQLRTQTVATGLAQPVGVYYPPGDANRLFVVEQNGTIRIIDLTTNPPTVSGSNFLNIGPGGLALTAANGERGLLGLAFDPNYQTNGRFYVNYTTNGTSFFSRIDRFTVNGTPATATSANTASRITLLQWSRPAANHNGGAIAFGPDGMLYVGAGDSGGANDPSNLAVNLDALQGKILRLDVNDSSAADGDGVYVPDDNPFRSFGGVVRPYIWAYGCRNPWRLTFDRGTGDLWIGDVGQDAREEINWQPAYVPGPGGNFAQVAGRHYGWDCREGLIAAPGGGACDPNAVGVYTPPIKDYTHGAPDNACSISGGHVYRGSAIPSLVGAYVVADYCGNWVRSFRNNNGVVSDLRDWTSQLGSAAINGLVAINEDAAGELYMVSINLGAVYKIVPETFTPCGGACPAPVNQLATVFFDPFDANLGWTTSVAGATDGLWQRGVPVAAANGYAFNPPYASGGSGSAFVTENTDPAAGTTTSDVDGGSVILTSPLINGARGQLTICYDYYLVLTQTGGANPDGLFVEVSNDGGSSWTRVRSYTSNQAVGCTWTRDTITTAQLSAAGVTNQANVRIRFIASDNSSPDQSIVEAALDNVRVQTGNPLPDCNNNGIADATDIANATSADCNSNSIPDECEISTAYYAAQAANNPALRIDLDGGPLGVIAAGGTLFNSTCVGCHGANGVGGGTGPNIRGKDSFFIRERIVFNRPALHPGGGYTSLVAQDFANLEAFLADGGSRGRPDGIIDSCQTLPDCDNDTVSNGRELELGTQVDLDYDGIPDPCETVPCPADFNGNDGVTVQDIFDFLSAWNSSLPSADFNGVDGVTVQDIFDFLSAWNNGCP
jgi:glucose/arabinose dehydrogenase